MSDYEGEDWAHKVAKLDAEVERLTEESALWKACHNNQFTRAEAAEAERDRYKAALKSAPHDSQCAIYTDKLRPCSCWKAEAVRG